MAKTERTPWRRWIAAAGAFGLTPRQFWRLSLAEWRALAAPAPAAALNRAGFDALSRSYPDQI